MQPNYLTQILNKKKLYAGLCVAIFFTFILVWPFLFTYKVEFLNKIPWLTRFSNLPKKALIPAFIGIMVASMVIFFMGALRLYAQEIDAGIGEALGTIIIATTLSYAVLATSMRSARYIDIASSKIGNVFGIIFGILAIIGVCISVANGIINNGVRGENLIKNKNHTYTAKICNITVSLFASVAPLPSSIIFGAYAGYLYYQNTHSIS